MEASAIHRLSSNASCLTSMSAMISVMIINMVGPAIIYMLAAVVQIKKTQRALDSDRIVPLACTKPLHVQHHPLSK